MRDCGGWNKGSGAGGEFNDETAVPKDKVSAAGGVEASQRRDAAPAERKVGTVPMFEAGGVGAEIKGGSGPYAIGEVYSVAGVVFREGREVICVIGKEPRGPCFKRP